MYLKNRHLKNEKVEKLNRHFNNARYQGNYLGELSIKLFKSFLKYVYDMGITIVFFALLSEMKIAWF